jgi:arginyl-tRNA synthetase
MRRALDQGVGERPLVAPTVDAERDLMLELLRLPEVVDRAMTLRAPNHIAEFAYEVAGRFNRFYDTCHILSEPDPERQGSWLLLAAWTLRALERLLDLLGIEVPDRM